MYYKSKYSKYSTFFKKKSFYVVSVFAFIIITIYYTIIYPFLIYCNAIWLSKTRQQSIFKIQKKIIRIMTFLNHTEESRSLFESLLRSTMGDRKSNFVFALGCLCKCMRNISRLFLCRANLPRFHARIWPHFHVKTCDHTCPSLQHTN